MLGLGLKEMDGSTRTHSEICNASQNQTMYILMADIRTKKEIRCEKCFSTLVFEL